MSTNKNLATFLTASTLLLIPCAHAIPMSVDTGASNWVVNVPEQTWAYPRQLGNSFRLDLFLWPDGEFSFPGGLVSFHLRGGDQGIGYDRYYPGQYLAYTYFTDPDASKQFPLTILNNTGESITLDFSGAVSPADPPAGASANAQVSDPPTATAPEPRTSWLFAAVVLLLLLWHRKRLERS